MDYRKPSRKSVSRKNLKVESLESRIVLTANNFGEVTGALALDSNENGVIDAGEQVAGASVQLWLDLNGNGQVDANDDMAGLDITDANGMYTFSGLQPGNYFVEQPAQVVDGVSLASRSGSVVVIDRGFVEGSIVDDFSGSGGVETDLPDNVSVDDVFDAAGALGGQRDLSVSIAGNINFDEGASASVANGLLNVTGDETSTTVVTWDGVDAAGEGLDANGLGGIDLSGAAFRLEGIGIPDSGASISIRVYSNATDFSESIPMVVGNELFTDIGFPFVSTGFGRDGFIATGGNGADFTNVGAIELEIETALDGASLTINEFQIVNLETVSVNVFAEVAAPDPSDIDLQISVNGFNCDEVNCAEIQLDVGTEFTVGYTVTNTGGMALESINLVDEIEGVIGVEDRISQSINTDEILDVGEVWVYENVQTATLGAYNSMAGIVGADVGSPLTGAADTAFVEYLGVAPAPELTFTVLTNGQDVNDVASAETVAEGSDVTFNYGVFNSGSVEITDVVVEDDNGTPTDSTDDFFAEFVSGDEDGDGILDPDEAWIFSATRTAAVGTFSNLATATGLDPSSNPVAITDRGFYIGEAAAFTWHNEALPQDVNNNGVVNPLDANIVVTELNLREFSDPESSALVELTAAAPAFYDVNNDGFVSPLDALLIINDLPTSEESRRVLTRDTDKSDNDKPEQSLESALTPDGAIASLEVSRAAASFKASVHDHVMSFLDWNTGENR